MKVTLITKDFAKKTNVVSRFASLRAQLPILSNIKLKAEGNKLLMTATNLEMSIATYLGAKVDDEGEISIPAKTFSELINTLRSEHLELESEGESLKISTPETNTKINGINTADFPDVPEKNLPDTIKLNSSDIKRSLSQVLFSTSPDDTRPALAGVLVIFDKGISFVASDGFRLSQKTVDVQSSLTQRIIIPKATAQEFSKLIADFEGEIIFSYSQENSQILLEIDSYLISSRVIDGEYPNFEKIIPTSHRIEVSVDKHSLLNAIKTVAIFAREVSNIIDLKIENNEIILSSQSPKSGVQESRVPVKVSGGELTISYNYKYIEDFLNSIQNDDVLIELNDGSSAGVFRDSQDKNYLHLIMPVKI